MNLFVAVALVLGTTAAAIAVMLLVRRGAPEGSYFADGDRAAGVFGVLATGFAVLLGLVVVLAFTSYDASRSGAEDEATIVGQQYEVAQLMAPAGGRQLAAELVCYARSVVFQEWPQMESGTQPEGLNPWGAELFRTFRRIDPQTPSEQAAYAKWLDQRLDRESARSARIHGAAGVIPAPLWIILFLTAAVIAGFMLMFADSGERAFVPGQPDRDGGAGDGVHAAPDLRARQPVREGARPVAADGHDADAAAARSGAAHRRGHDPGAVRRARHRARCVTGAARAYSRPCRSCIRPSAASSSRST